jgi:hypothetical protein
MVLHFLKNSAKRIALFNKFIRWVFRDSFAETIDECNMNATVELIRSQFFFSFLHNFQVLYQGKYLKGYDHYNYQGDQKEERGLEEE